MIEKQVKIIAADGLHMRPSMRIVDEAAKFNSKIVVKNGEQEADGKSIMQMTMLAATCGDTLTIKADGEDEQEAVNALQELISSNFHDYLEEEK